MLTEQLKIKEKHKYIDKNINQKNKKDAKDMVFRVMKKNIDMFIRLRDK